jgi:hypothetical protein
MFFPYEMVVFLLDSMGLFKYTCMVAIVKFCVEFPGMQSKVGVPWDGGRRRMVRGK